MQDRAAYPTDRMVWPIAFVESNSRSPGRIRSGSRTGFLLMAAADALCYVFCWWF